MTVSLYITKLRNYKLLIHIAICLKRNDVLLLPVFYIGTYTGHFLSLILETILKFNLPDALISEFNEEEPEEFVYFSSK